MKRSIVSMLLKAVVLSTVGAFGVACVDDATLLQRDVTVRPRVIVDGTVELSSRTSGRIVLDEVTAHANKARVVTSASAGDTVTLDDDSVFFRFAPKVDDAQQATERRWSLPVDGGELRLGFAPADDDAIDAAPFDASVLAGHTVVVAGTIAIETSPQPYSAETSVGFRAGDEYDNDPDGTLADSDPDGTLADSDPDGTLADSDPDGTLADGDPDGTLAKGTRGETDPDGTPARSKENRSSKVSGQFAHRTLVRVPFVLTADGTFTHDAVIDGDAVASLGDDEVLPIDVVFAAASFFNDDRLAVLDTLAAMAVSSGEETASLQVSADTTARVVDVVVNAGVAAKRVKASTKHETSQKIVVTGPRPR